MICTRNRPSLLRRTLGALALQSLPQGRFEVVVVDDGPDNEETAGVCREMAAQMPHLNYVRTSRHVGLAAARNLGVEAAVSDLLLFTDDDCVPHPSWVAAMIEALDEHGVVAGAVDWPAVESVLLCHNIAEFYGVMACRREGPITFLAGANMGVRRAVLEEVGGFGEQMNPGEDVAFALRARRSGYVPWFSNRPVVHHIPDRTTWTSIFSYAAWHASSMIILRNRNRSALRTPLVLRSAPLLLLSSPLLALGVTARIYLGCPPLRRFWWTMPAVFALKLAWCAGAVRGLARR